MSISISPSVEIFEKDYSYIIPAVSISKIGMIGKFAKGIIEKPTLITNEYELIEMFGTPDEHNFKDFYTASNILKYSNFLKIVRVLPQSARNGILTYRIRGIDKGSGEPINYEPYSILSETQLIKNDDEEITITFNENEILKIFSKYPNFQDEIYIAIANYEDFYKSFNNQYYPVITDESGNTILAFKDVFEYAPQNNKQFALVVLKKSYTGDLEVVEKYICSFDKTDFNDNGENIFVETILKKSNYIRAFANLNLVEENLISSFPATKIRGDFDGILNFKYLENYQIISANYVSTSSAPSPNSHPSEGEKYVYIDATNNKIIIYIASDDSWMEDDEITLDGKFVIFSPTGGSDSAYNDLFYKTYEVIIDNGSLTYTDISSEFKRGDALKTDIDKCYYFNEINKPWDFAPYDENAFPINTHVPLSDVINGFEKFKNPEEIDINILIDGGFQDNEIHNKIHEIVEFRKDCIGIITPPYEIFNYNSNSEIISELEKWRKETFNISSSYIAIYGNWKLQYDKYYDVERWIPVSGDVAGLISYTDYVAESWYATAGEKRGVLRDTIKLKFNPTKTERDVMYSMEINPIITKSGVGHVIWGQKTALHRQSGFNRINVRRLFIVLEKAISNYAERQLFEFNDAITRRLFVATVEPYLRDIKGRRGIYDFKVVCDETNNTPEVIDREEFIADIYIKPTRVAEFIRLNFINVATGLKFEEIITKL